MYKQETIQSYHRNYFSVIRGDNDKLLEYISKPGGILIQYYFSDDNQKKAALLQQYRVLMEQVKMSKIQNGIQIVKTKKRYFNQKDVMFVKNAAKLNLVLFLNR